jgi:hypothetical protein
MQQPLLFSKLLVGSVHPASPRTDCRHSAARHCSSGIAYK